MKQFFQQRVAKHQKKMQRYLRYVINDHFALTMTFLVGGLGFYYADLLKTLPSPFPLGNVIVLVFWLMTLHLGHFASLTQLPDAVFLLPKERAMRQYLVQAFLYSCYLPFGLLILTTAFSMPLVVVASTKVTFQSTAFFILLLWIVKASHLFVQQLAFYQGMRPKRWQFYSLWLSSSTAILAVSLFYTYLLGLALAIIQVGSFYLFTWKKNTARLDWERLIQVEQSRLHRLYQFIHLFTDVPEMKGQVKRRKHFDILLQKIPLRQENTYLYLFARHFLRGTEYSGLYLRLVVIGGLFLAFINEIWFALGIGALFLYLIGFQLLPLGQQFRYTTTVLLYPLATSQKEQALKKLLTVLLFDVAAVFSVIVSLTLTNWSAKLLVSGSYFVFVGLFVQFYLPYRFAKTNKKLGI